MSIAISLKIKDGVILASDSAATMSVAARSGVTHVYNNANKIINLHKQLPLGVVTWGSAGIGNYSNELLLKNLRQRLTDGGKEKNDKWRLNEDDYSIKDIAEKLRKYIYEEHYLNSYNNEQDKPHVGFMIAGYAPQNLSAEEYLVEIKNGDCAPPEPLRDKESVGITWRGEGEVLRRLLLGIGSKTEAVLKKTGGLGKETIEKVLKQLQPGIQESLITPAMPLQDGINLAEFLVNVTIMYSRYTAGAPTVGGPVEIAAITKHEKFKWIKRKHYYPPELNP